MKIKNIKIEGYKNLEIDLIHNSDIIALIGNNGSGKSNLLEALSLIFRSLYKKSENVSFDYFIEYITTTNKNIKIDKKKSKITYKIDDTVAIGIDEYLPKKVVALYSGEEQRLWNKIYFPIYDDFIKSINRSTNSGLMTKTNEMPQMLYLNKYYWHLSLLSLVISDLDDNKSFVKDVLKIKSVDKIKFVFNKTNYKNYAGNSVLNFINSIDKKSEYTLGEFKKIVSENGFSDTEVFNYLYVANSPKGSKIIDDIIILYNEHLTIEDFSEGEKKLLLIKSAFEFAEQEDSLFILDEPDAHIHLNNKEQIIRTFEPYKNNRQIVITTHSPTVTQAIDDDNCLFMINSGKIIEKKKQEIIGDLTNDFWNKHQQSSFLSSQKKLILLVEGKHDKLHITNAYNKLKDEYPKLDFDIFSMSGANNIPQLITGLRTSDTKLNKTIIAIFDNDDEGKDNCNKTQVSYNGQLSKLHKSGFFAIKYDNDKKIVEGDGFTVENMYDSSFYEEAFKEALSNYSGKFENKFIDKITKEIKEEAKTILANKSSNFEKEDFKYFRKLFNLIGEIYSSKKELKETKEQLNITKTKVTSEDTQTENKREDKKEIVEQLGGQIVTPTKFVNITGKRRKGIITESSHIKGKPKNIIALYEELKKEILSLNDDLKIVPVQTYITIKYKNKNIVGFNIQNNGLKVTLNAKMGELKGNKGVFKDVSKIGHNAPGDYEIIINSNEHNDYILELVKQVISLKK